MESLKLRWMLVLIIVWFVACLAGTAGQSLPRQVFYQTAEGQSIDFCVYINPTAVAEGTSQSDWCTADTVVGSSLPTDVKSSVGGISLHGFEASVWIDVLTRPDLWLTIGLGTAAILCLFLFTKASGTMRAGIAAAVTIVFFGLLLFPTGFTNRIPADMRGELVSAWQWVVLFYFGSEAAVQAWKVAHPGAEGIPGDAPTPDPVAARIAAAQRGAGRGRRGGQGGQGAQGEPDGGVEPT